MTDFSYKAIDEGGVTVTGVINADSVVMAEIVFVARGHIP